MRFVSNDSGDTWLPRYTSIKLSQSNVQVQVDAFSVI